MPDVPDGLVGDAARLRQVLINLAGNAIKFTERGDVALRVELAGLNGEKAGLRVSIRDTGIGIPKEKQDYIFEMFAQADTSSTRRYGGTGLGLAISQQLLRLMGGCLEVDSEVGKGSTFHFTLSLAAGPTTAASPASGWPGSAGGVERREQDPERLREGALFCLVKSVQQGPLAAKQVIKRRVGDGQATAGQPHLHAPLVMGVLVPAHQPGLGEPVNPVGHRARGHQRGVQQSAGTELVRRSLPAQRREHIELPRLQPMCGAGSSPGPVQVPAEP